MGVWFEPEEIDDLDESLIEAMDDEELEEFRDKLEDTLDELQGQEPDEEEDEDAFYEWEDRINILNDLIDAIGDKLGS